MVTYQERMAEWKALHDYAYENYADCMQRHWQKCIRQRAKPSERG